MVKVKNNLGLTKVFDLVAQKEVEVDHRTIESIIFKNVKYTVKKDRKAGGQRFCDIDTDF